MSTRTFEFSEGTSNKFWSITLDGSTHAVRYGRIGTSGQTQTASFASEAEAQKSYDKLIAEKLKKGYVEKDGDGGVVTAPSLPRTRSAAPAPQSLQTAPEPPASASASTENQPPPPSTIAAAMPPEPASAGEYTVRRKIDLDVAAFSYVPASRAAPKPMMPAEPFNLEDCLTRLRTAVLALPCGWELDCFSVIPERAIAPEEAEFWLTAMTTRQRQLGAGERDEDFDSFAAKLSQQSFRGNLPPLPADLSRWHLSPHAVLCLAALMSTDDLCRFMVTETHNRPELRMGFRRFVLPYLDEAAIASCRSIAKASWDPSTWPTDFYKLPAPAFYFGAMLGLHDEVRALVEQWPDDQYANSSWDHTHYHRPQEVVYGVGPAEQVAHHFRRLKLPTKYPEDIFTFLAITGTSALDVVARTIAATGKREEAEELFEAFARAHTPEAAPHALQLALSSKAPKLAREWLENNLDEAVVGLMPVAVSTGKLADAAIEFLTGVKRQGHAGRIAAHLGTVDSQVAARIRAKVLDVVEEQLSTLPRNATPAWWTQALAQTPLKKSKALSWVSPANLPAITIGEHALGHDHIVELLGALQASTLETPHPLLRALREHAAPDRLDAFGWKLFDSWIGDGAPPKEKWAFLAAGFLGGDRTAIKLAALVRAWPGESQHQRAVLGLDVLRTIGSDTALMQINGIAQKVKFKGLKERAVQCMDAIAASRGMTRAELEDRIVPDCELDERGQRIFDFGPRQFRFVLGPELKPMIRYPDGATKPDLPKPAAKDDAAKAVPAVAEWKLLKKQIADVAKIQAVRLEQAMVTGRRWSAEELDRLLVRHPLMVHLVRLLVWASYEPSGAVAATFRVTEDQTLGDAADEPFALPRDARVGVLHPLQLTERAHLLEQWGQLFGDYEIVQPFSQLGRPAYHLTPEQLAGNTITHFESRAKLPAQSLVFGLEKLGWQRGVPADAGWVGEHSKQFYGANVTAVINYEEGFSVGYWEGAGEQTIKRVFFIPGLYTPRMYPEHKNALRLADVDPIAVSEVLGDCEHLLAKVA